MVCCVGGGDLVLYSHLLFQEQTVLFRALQKCVGLCEFFSVLAHLAPFLFQILIKEKEKEKEKNKKKRDTRVARIVIHICA